VRLVLSRRSTVCDRVQQISPAVAKTTTQWRSRHLGRSL
jgi:hypothetical protein